MSRRLDIYFPRTTEVSFDPLESDYFGNGLVLSHLIGTLVRWEGVGRFAPALARTWEVSSDRTRWDFELDTDWGCEDGTRLTAGNFIQGFELSVRPYARKSKLLAFQQLFGWNAFLDGGRLEGLIALSESRLRFQFVSPVEEGFLEYLAMSYFGFYSAANFENSKWIDKRRIVSSSNYSLESAEADRTFLKLRDEGKERFPLAPTELVFHSSVENEHAFRGTARAICAKLSWADADPDPINWNSVIYPPETIRTVTLDEYASEFFRDRDCRLRFASMLREVQKSASFRSKTDFLTYSFYPNDKVPDYPIVSSDRNPHVPLKVLAPAIQHDEHRYIQEVVVQALKRLSWPYELIIPDAQNGISALAVSDRKSFDIRLNGVFAGDTMEPWIVQMMFNSDLGISYPDPTRRIAALDKASVTSQMVSQIVFEDAAVIPMVRMRLAWYFSSDLDISSLNLSDMKPDFELIRFRPTVD